jgi:hypothetical protein
LAVAFEEGGEEEAVDVGGVGVGGDARVEVGGVGFDEESEGRGIGVRWMRARDERERSNEVEK